MLRSTKIINMDRILLIILGVIYSIDIPTNIINNKTNEVITISTEQLDSNNIKYNIVNNPFIYLTIEYKLSS